MVNSTTHDNSIIGLWKYKMGQILDYFTHRPPEEIDNILNTKIQQCFKPANATWRNIYEYTQGVDDANTILTKVHNDNNIVCANGAIIYDPKQVPSPIAHLLIDKRKERDIFKDLMKIAIGKSDKMGERTYDSLQVNVKEFMNSVYGIMTQKGSVVANSDSASAITLQSRELISEMLWSIEKFLSGNVSFYNSNEMILYFYEIMHRDQDLTAYTFLDYIPSVEQCLEKFNNSLFEMDKKDEFVTSKTYKSIIQKIELFTPEERMKYFYTDNLIGLFKYNKIFKEIFEQILTTNESFYNPYDIPQVYNELIEKIWYISYHLVLSGLLTYKRVEKYKKRSRRSIVVSDTDSIMISLDPYIQLIDEMFDHKFNIVANKEYKFKIVNILSKMLSNVCEHMCYRFSVAVNIPESERARLSMKNEFYFMRMVLLDVKKNYTTLAGLREGVLIPDKNAVMATGLAFGGSLKNPHVKPIEDKIIRELILEPIEINPIRVLSAITTLENQIISEIRKGNKEYLSLGKFKGTLGYSNIEGHQLVRGVMIWNRLYPDNDINIGDTVYMVKTKVETISDAENLIKDPIIREKVLDLVFDYKGRHKKEFQGLDFSKFGLRSICITPAQSTPIPDWLIDIIDYDHVVNLHLRTLKAISASIGIRSTKPNSKTVKLSRLINF